MRFSDRKPLEIENHPLLHQGQHIFSIKAQIVNMSGFADQEAKASILGVSLYTNRESVFSTKF